MLGFDPEVPAGFQDADIEMAELSQLARDVENEARENLVRELGRLPNASEWLEEIDRLYADGFGG